MYTVGHPGRAERILDHPRLGARPVQDRVVFEPPALPPRLLDAADHEARFVDVVVGRVGADRLTARLRRAEVLAEAARVVGDDRVRGGEDPGRRAVVLLELVGRDAREVVRELPDVLDARAAPAVDRLIVVSDHEELSAIPREERDPGVLQGVGVLELVDQQMPESLLVLREDLRTLPQHLPGAKQQLREIGQPARLARRLVGSVHVRHPPFPEVAGLGEMAGADPLLLLAVDEPLRLFRRPAPPRRGSSRA